MKTLDEIDRDFLKNILIKCQSILKMRMTDPDVCEKNRDRSREYAKMSQKAIDILKEKQMITLDEIDRDYIKDILIKCKAILKIRMTDPKIC